MVFVLSVPLWLLHAASGVPVSILNAFIPLAAAAVLVYRKDGAAGVKRLLEKPFDFATIKARLWLLPTLGLLPLVYALAYWWMHLDGLELPERALSLWWAPVLLLVFFVLAAGEEAGWSGYALGPLQERWSALNASLIIGTVWAVWHILPDLQADHAASWILWQRTYTVVLRILIVWLVNNTGGSVFAASVFHATDNMSFALFPNYGSHYDPFYTCTITLAVAAVVVAVWGPRSLGRSRGVPAEPTCP